MGTQTMSSTVTSRWRRHQRGIPMTTKVSAMVMVSFFLFSSVISYYIAWQTKESRLEEARIRATSLSANFVQLYVDALQEHGHRSLSGVQVVLDNWFVEGSARGAEKDLAWAFVLDENGEVVVGRLRVHLVDAPAGLDTDEQLRSWFLQNQKEVSEGYIVRTAKIEKASENGERLVLGEARIGYSPGRIWQKFYQQVLIAACVSFGIAALAGVILLLYLRTMLLSPLRLLAHAMEDVRRGNFDTRARIVRSDEMGALSETFNAMAAGLEEREKIKDAFVRIASKEVVDQVLEAGENLAMHGETRRVTVLFSDIRGFTTMSEKLLPDQVVKGLNEYFTDMVDVVTRHDGWVSKFIGDAMMAVWGAPVEQDQPELRAVRAALEMQEALTALNNRRTERGDQPMQIGVGINTGYALAGPIGHVDRLDYTVIGDAVNVAQRIESQTKKVHRAVLVSERTYLEVAPFVVAEELPTILVKGKEEPLKLYAIISMVREEDVGEAQVFEGESETTLVGDQQPVLGS